MTITISNSVRALAVVYAVTLFGIDLEKIVTKYWLPYTK